jgi:hypothetical protein
MSEVLEVTATRDNTPFYSFLCATRDSCPEEELEEHQAVAVLKMHGFKDSDIAHIISMCEELQEERERACVPHQQSSPVQERELGAHASNGITNLKEDWDKINWSCPEWPNVCSTDVSNAVTPERCILASPSGSGSRTHDGNISWHNESAPCWMEYSSSCSGSSYQRHLSHVYQIATAARAGHNVSILGDDGALAFDVNTLAVSTTPPSRYCSDSSWDAVKPERLSSVNKWLSMEENWLSYSASSSSLDYCPSQELHDASNVESPLPPPFPGYTRVHLNL